MEESQNTTPTNENAPISTTDYSQFKYIDSNRSVNKRHVQELIESFTSFPDLIPKNPILVNEKMEIIDGQHRLQAASTLRIPVYYIVAKGTSVEDAQMMNATQRSWSIVDFARSYALNRDDENRATQYRTFLALYEEYNIPISTLIAFCEQRTRKNATAIFKKGQFVIKDEEVTRKLLNEAEAIMETLSKEVISHSRYNIISALLRVLQNDKYDHERMVAKLAQKPLPLVHSKNDYLRAFEDTYNFNMKSDDSIIRFF